MQPVDSPRQHPSRSGRLLELDALRGLAAVAVVLFHYTTRYDQLFGHSATLQGDVGWGHYGVDLFFMLSGFVILMTLERTADTWRFAWGRFTRLYPAYWAAAALTFVVVACCGLPGQELSIREALVNLTMIQSLLGSPHIDGAYWSLQAELIFYANMLFIYRWGAFRKPLVTVVGWVGLATLVHCTRELAAPRWALVTEVLDELATVASLEFIPLFAIGILFYTSRGSVRMPRQTLATWIGCLLAVGLVHGTKTMVVDAALSGILLGAVQGRLRFLATRLLVYLGAISYTLYLSHQNIGYVIIRYLESSGVGPPVAILLSLLSALLLADLLHRLVEKPSMQMLRRVDLRSIVTGFRVRSATN